MNSRVVTSKFLSDIQQGLAPLFRENISRVNLKYKGIDNPVTAMDLAVSEAFFRLVEKLGFHEHEVLSEEHAEKFSTDLEKFWVIDPIDGTKEFLQKIPEYVVSVGLVSHGEAVAGFLYNPENQFYISLAEEQIECRLPSNFTHPDLSVLVSRSEIKKGLFQRIRYPYEIVPMGSIAYKLGLVAAKKAKAVVSLQPKHSWDICAGVALVNGAGGIVTDLKGKKIQFHQPMALYENGLVACADPAELDEIIRRSTI